MVLMVFIGISCTLWKGLSRSLFHVGITEPILARCHFVLWFWIPPGPVPKRNQCFDSQHYHVLPLGWQDKWNWQHQKWNQHQMTACPPRKKASKGTWTWH
jgi:hypothetical protein